MSVRRWLPLSLLVLLFVAAGVGIALTRPLPPPAAESTETSGGRSGRDGAPPTGKASASSPAKDAQPASGQQPPRRRRERIVDSQPLLTARRLAAQATTPEELELARQAKRLADHAIDVQFAESLRSIAENPAEQTPEIQALVKAKAEAQAAVATAQVRVDELTGEGLSSPPEERQGHLEVAKAQLELARDELTEASERLAREGGDPQAVIQRLRASYEAAQKDEEPSVQVVAAQPAPAAAASASVLARLRAWTALRGRIAQLGAAQGEALERVDRLVKRTERITKRIQEGEALERGDVTVAKLSDAERATAIRRLSQDRRRITGIGRRLQDFQELAEVYVDWIAVVEVQARAALHRLLLGSLWVLVVLALVFAGSRVAEHMFGGTDEEATRTGTLRGVAKIAVQGTGLLTLIFVVFGAPSQATTILGLAGAGLTVALKDFIVAFFGWFILMRRNGIRVGDWVEIKGVGGEVAEIGLLHTVLLETGSWTSAGHPTGRRVSFVNSFAIEGHYFNFSTSGQWLWDSLQVLVPTGQDPYPIIDGVQRLVERETEANQRLAEQEWQKTTSRYRVRTFSAVPGINVAPTSNGVQLDVRYITRAYERHTTRQRLYHAVVELMHKREAEPAASAG